MNEVSNHPLYAKPELAGQTSSSPIEPVAKINNEHAIGYALEYACSNEVAEQFAWAFNQLRPIAEIRMHYEPTSQSLILTMGDTQYQIQLTQEEINESFENEFERIREVVRGRLEAEQERIRASKEREDRSRRRVQTSAEREEESRERALRLLLNDLPGSTQRAILDKAKRDIQGIYAPKKQLIALFNKSIEQSLNAQGLYLPKSNTTYTDEEKYIKEQRYSPAEQPKPKETDSIFISTSLETTDNIPKANSNISELHKRIASLRERVDAQTARIQTTNPYNTENNNEETKQSHSTIHTNRRHNREEEK